MSEAPLPDGRPRLVFCGAATLDTMFRVHTLPRGPGKVLPYQMAVVAHGMASSAAAAAARLGAEVTLFSRAGADTEGRRIRDDLAAEGIDCSALRLFEGIGTPLATVIVEDDGERLVVPFYDPNMPADPDWLPLDKVAGADAVLADPRWPEAAEVVFNTARAAGVPSVLDADVAPEPILRRLAPLASHVVCSEPAALLLSGAQTPEAALDILTAELPGFVAITIGAGGCLWREEGQRHQARPPAVEAVDTLAAGDVFHGSFTWALAQGTPLARCIEIANAAAAVKCTRFGGRLGTPTRTELSRILAGETP